LQISLRRVEIFQRQSLTAASRRRGQSVMLMLKKSYARQGAPDRGEYRQAAGAVTKVIGT
jgi:hypothetical protein